MTHEVVGAAVCVGDALPSRLAADRDRAVVRWKESIDSMRALPAPTPLPPWYLWPLLATVFDIEGTAGRAPGQKRT